MTARWRPAVRLARREARRRPWRTLLVVVLVALPVAGVTVGAIAIRTGAPSLQEEQAGTFGLADVVLGQSAFPLPEREEIASAVLNVSPPGSRPVIVTDTLDAVVEADGSLVETRVTDHPLDEPLLEGTIALVDGRAPERRGEVAVSRTLLDETGLEVGGVADLFRHGRARITGEVIDRDSYGRSLAVRSERPEPHPDSRYRIYVATPGNQEVDLDDPALHELDIFPEGSTDAGQRDDEVRDGLTAVYVAGGVALLIMAIVASSAFAVGARRQLRTLGLLAAAGAAPADLRRTVLLQGTVSGCLGAVAGVTVGLGAMLILEPHLDELVGDYITPLDVRPLDLLGAAFLGIVAATAAAWFPSRTAAKVPVLAALAGRRPQPCVPIAVHLRGLAVAVAGTVVLGVWSRGAEPAWGIGLAAATAALLGTVAIAPWLVTHLEPLAGRLRGGGKVAARGLARNRLRSGAVVAAVLAPASLAVLGSSALVTNAACSAADATAVSVAEPGYVPFIGADQVLLSASAPRLVAERLVQVGLPPADVLGRVRRELPDAVAATLVVVHVEDQILVNGQTVVPILRPLTVGLEPDVPADTDSSPEVDGSPGVDGGRLSETVPLSSTVAVGGDRLLDALGAPAAATDALGRGEVVALGGRPSSPSPPGVPFGPGDVTVVDSGRPPTAGAEVPAFVVSPETAAGWGLATVETGTLLRAPEPLSADQRDAVQGALYADPDEQLLARLRAEGPSPQDPGVVATMHYPPGGGDEASLGLRALAVAATFLFTLGVVAAALALTAAETRDEHAVLEALGAPPAVRRSVLAWQAFLLPLLAMALAVPLGMGVAFAVLSARDDGAAVQVPWSTLAGLLIVVPLLSAVVVRVASGLSGRRFRGLSSSLATE
ncbi:hypothetical protein BH24ACT3_BH24ACT3_00120 [soil metagenome]